MWIFRQFYSLNIFHSTNPQICLQINCISIEVQTQVGSHKRVLIFNIYYEKKGGIYLNIALFGKIRSGKDSVGKILIEEHNFKRFAFGDGIGEIISKYFPEDWAGGKPRKHYQHVGQELRRLDENVWVNYLTRNVWESGRQYRIDGKEFNVVVTDGRQLNEAVKLKEEGFTIIKVTCPEEIRVARMKKLGDIFTPEQLNHETELQVDLIEPDIELINDGTIEELHNKVQKIITELRGN